ncbi:hypothetical protein ACFXB3_34715 [Streptomyces sp. NPDC059447]|uniref:hypothetical protein n=1 Tax=Streptomyces sp. NPDC059447 TaxID=3346834 RepID=UPI0036BFDCFD
MPRRRPGALRAARGDFEGRWPSAWARELPPVDRLSPAASAEVHWALRGRAREVEILLNMYRTFLRRPGNRLRLSPSLCESCPGCARDDVALVRDELAELYRGLPSEARHALGRVLHALDKEFRRRTLPASVPFRIGPDWRGRPYAWWHRRVYEGT